MTLPNLPRTLNKREANWTTTVFRGWLERYGKTGVYEVKHTGVKNYLNFKEVKLHQRQNLLKVRHGNFVYKVPDMGERTPFDLFSLSQQPAYVVIKYPKGAIGISINTFLLEEKKSKRKSLLWDRAVCIASFIIK